METLPEVATIVKSNGNINDDNDAGSNETNYYQDEEEGVDISDKDET